MKASALHYNQQRKIELSFMASPIPSEMWMILFTHFVSNRSEREPGSVNKALMLYETNWTLLIGR